jgi:hypothetical protein
MALAKPSKVLHLLSRVPPHANQLQLGHLASRPQNSCKQAANDTAHIPINKPLHVACNYRLKAASSQSEKQYLQFASRNYNQIYCFWTSNCQRSGKTSQSPLSKSAFLRNGHARKDKMVGWKKKAIYHEPLISTEYDSSIYGCSKKANSSPCNNHRFFYCLRKLHSP